MIVEFLGIPGSGKTYNKQLYIKQLKNAKRERIDISRWKGMPFCLKLFYKFSDYSIFLFPKYRRLFKLYKDACVVKSDSSKYFPLSFDTCLRDIVQASFLHDFFGKWNRIVLNDEGQLQRIVTLAVQYEVEIEDLMSVYLAEHHPEETMFVEISTDDAFCNIKTRNRHDCKMDEMNDDMLKNYLNDFDNACKMCMKMIKTNEDTTM